MKTRMKYGVPFSLLVLSAAVILTGCEQGPSSQQSAATDRSPLVGAWRSKVTFGTGPLAG